MDADRIRAHLVAISTLIDALLDELEESEPPCTHPDDQLENRSSMGNPDYYCRACGTTIQEWPTNGDANQ